MSKRSRRVALIHATPVAVNPVMEAFLRLWPEAEPYNLLEDSLEMSRAVLKFARQALVVDKAMRRRAAVQVRG
jgi:hypothetical protein